MGKMMGKLIIFTAVNFRAVLWCVCRLNQGALWVK